jgi:osmotically inducible protein OsmC
MQRTAQAVWHGSGKEGSGTLTTPSGVLNAQPYSFKLRFVDESGVNGTNPEELIAAAHAGCFSMALSFQLSNAGHVPDEIQTQVVLAMESSASGWSITGSTLKVSAKVPGIDQAKFLELAGVAKANCPVSRALSVPITLEATLAA